MVKPGLIFSAIRLTSVTFRFILAMECVRLYLEAFLIIVLSVQNYGGAQEFIAARNNHRSQQLTDDQVLYISQMSNKTRFENILDPILIPRVVGTENHEKVKKYLADEMSKLGWEVEVDSFVGNTPLGKLDFANVIAMLNPNASRFLALACHYDSKLMREGNFIGATDSAVPCAMMLDLAYAMKKDLDSVKNKDDLSLKLIFFDGEEAFQRWGPRDSIYGARHLAAKWEKTPFPASNRDGTNYLHKLDMLVLLDLIGAPDPAFYSFFPSTERWYRKLVSAEKKLTQLGQLTKYSFQLGGSPQQYFQERSTYSGIEDDHIPFLERKVPILHLITYPFPDVWHTPRDNKSALDFDVIDNLNKIIRLFVAGYLHCV